MKQITKERELKLLHELLTSDSYFAQQFPGGEKTYNDIEKAIMNDFMLLANSEVETFGLVHYKRYASEHNDRILLENKLTEAYERETELNDKIKQLENELAQKGATHEIMKAEFAETRDKLSVAEDKIDRLESLVDEGDKDFETYKKATEKSMEEAERCINLLKLENSMLKTSSSLYSLQLRMFKDPNYQFDESDKELIMKLTC